MATLDLCRAVSNIVRALKQTLVKLPACSVGARGEVLWEALADHHCQLQKSTGDTRNCALTWQAPPRTGLNAQCSYKSLRASDDLQITRPNASDDRRRPA